MGKEVVQDTSQRLKRSLGHYQDITSLNTRVGNAETALADIANNVKSFSSSVVNGDWAPAFQAAHDALPSGGGKISFNGSYTLKTPLVFTKRVVLQGLGHTQSGASDSQAASVLIKSGNFAGITIQGHGSVLRDFQLDGATGNGGDGIIVASSRVTLEHITVTNQGGNGVRIGNDASANCNFWRLYDLVSIYNGGHGVYLHDSQQQALPNTNAGLAMGIDTRNNGGDGVSLGYSIDSVFIAVSGQNNVGYGVKVGDYARGHQFYSTYTEANTAGGIVLTSNASKNIIFGFRQGVSADDITDNGTQNFVLGRDSQYNTLPFFKSPFSIKNFNIQDPAISGVWNFSKDPSTRDLIIQLMGTSSNANVNFKSGSTGTVTLLAQQLKIGTGATLKNHINQGATLDFTSIPANSTQDKTVTVTGVAIGDSVRVTAGDSSTPGTPLEAGLMVNAFVSAANTVTVRVANVTTSAIDPVSRAWKIDVWQH